MNKNILLFTEPAKSFTESCPVGSGRLGGMLFGGVEKEKIVLNELSVWSGGVNDQNKKGAYKALPEIIDLLKAGKNPEAEALVNKAFVCEGPGSSGGHAKDGPYGCYQVLGDLNLDFGAQGEVQNYRRELSLDQALASVRYKSGGVWQTRELIASAPDGVIIYLNRLSTWLFVAARFVNKETGHAETPWTGLKA